LNGVPVKIQCNIRISFPCIRNYQWELYHNSKQFYEKYVRANTQVPATDISQKITVGFDMDVEGNVSGITVVGDNIDGKFEDELRRTIAAMPLWKDEASGHSVRVPKSNYVINLEFQHPANDK
jgi:hypothetical protein